MTLEVSLLGEETLKDKIKCFTHYMFASMISGALSGFLYTIIVYLLLSWIPNLIKIVLLGIFIAIFLLNEMRIFKFKLPQREWQIPANWVSGPSIRNMWVWGLILGAGIFTYMPYATFYVLYIYLGMFKEPYWGILIGMLYGFFRSLPSFMFTSKKVKMNIKEIKTLYLNKGKMFKFLNGLSLLILLGFLIIQIAYNLS